jgi:hypothetical protein
VPSLLADPGHLPSRTYSAESNSGISARFACSSFRDRTPDNQLDTGLNARFIRSPAFHDHTADNRFLPAFTSSDVSTGHFIRRLHLRNEHAPVAI